jgi:hypothetical protein
MLFLILGLPDRGTRLQKAQAMVRIQETLIGAHGGEAVALLRGARAVWAEGDAFGAADITPAEGEFRDQGTIDG